MGFEKRPLRDRPPTAEEMAEIEAPMTPPKDEAVTVEMIEAGAKALCRLMGHIWSDPGTQALFRQRASVMLDAALPAMRAAAPKVKGVDAEMVVFRELVKRGIDQDTADQATQAAFAALSTRVAGDEVEQVAR